MGKSIEKIIMFVCNKCDERFESKDDAANCCLPEGIVFWKCSTCGKTYHCKDSACKCCDKQYRRDELLRELKALEDEC